MSDTPRLYVRRMGDTLEVVTDRLTLRAASGDIIAVEDHIRELFADVAEIRVLTIDEAPWSLAGYEIAPPLSRAA